MPVITASGSRSLPDAGVGSSLLFGLLVVTIGSSWEADVGERTMVATISPLPVFVDDAVGVVDSDTTFSLSVEEAVAQSALGDKLASTVKPSASFFNATETTYPPAVNSSTTMAACRTSGHCCQRKVDANQ